MSSNAVALAEETAVAPPHPNMNALPAAESFDIEGWRTHIRYSDKRERFLAWFRSTLGAGRPPWLKTEGSLRILDLGTGDGHVISGMVAAIRSALERYQMPPRDICVDLVEPHPAWSAHLRDRIATRRAGGASDVVWSVREERAESYLQSAGEPYDLIVASHLLYYIADWAAFLESAHQRLAENGRIVVVLADRRGGTYRPYQQLAARLSDAGTPHLALRFGGDFQTMLEREEWRHVAAPVFASFRFPAAAVAEWRAQGDGDLAGTLGFLYGCSGADVAGFGRDLVDRMLPAKTGETVVAHQDLVISIPKQPAQRRRGSVFAGVLSCYEGHAAEIMAAEDTAEGWELADGLTALLDIAPGMATADLGCGVGLFAEAMARRGASVLAVDASRALVERARAAHQHPLVTWRVGDVRRIELAPESLDRIVAGFLLLYLPDPLAEARRWRRWLRPGGRLLLTLPHPIRTAFVAAPADAFRSGLFPERWGDGSEVLEYHRTMESVIAILRRAGFALLRMESPSPPFKHDFFDRFLAARPPLRYPQLAAMVFAAAEEGPGGEGP